MGPRPRPGTNLLLRLLSMTDGAQQALRRTMEIYSKTTRFALACNASDKIIGEQAARAAVASEASFLCIYFFHLILIFIVSVCLSEYVWN